MGGPARSGSSRSRSSAPDYKGGYGAAKIAHEQATLAGPVGAHIVRAAQFHEFVPLLLDWGRQGDVSYVPVMRTQVVAARTVAEVVADRALARDGDFDAAGVSEVAGSREERLVEIARHCAARGGDPVRIEERSDPDDPDREINEGGGLLPGPDAVLAGPTFEEWLEARS